MNKLISKDGTNIAFDRYGKGPVVILVTGALGYRNFPTQTRLAEQVAIDV